MSCAPKGNVINPEVISLFLLDDKNRDGCSHDVASSTFPSPVSANLDSESTSVPAQQPFLKSLAHLPSPIPHLSPII